MSSCLQRGDNSCSQPLEGRIYITLNSHYFSWGDLEIGLFWFFFSNQTISYLRLISEGSSAIKEHAEVFALFHFPHARKLVVLIVLLCTLVYLLNESRCAPISV